MSARRAALAIACASVLLATRATAASRLRWTAPAACPTEESVSAAVDALVASPRRTTPFRARAVVTTGDDKRYRVTLRVLRPHGETSTRSIEGATCAEVADAVAVVLALAIDAAPEGPETPDSADPHATSDDPPMEVAPTPAKPVTRRFVWDVSALTGVDFSSLPSPTSGLVFGAGVGFGAHRVELRASAWKPRRASIAGGVIGGDFWLAAGELRYCRGLSRGPVVVSPCLGFEAGVMPASGVGVVNASSIGRWLAPTAAMLGVWSARPGFGVALELDALAALSRDRFLIRGVGQVFRPPEASVRALLGLRVEIP